MTHELRQQLTNGQAKIDQIRTACREMLRSLYEDNLGEVSTNMCNEKIMELIASECSVHRMVGAFAWLGMVDSMASLGDDVITSLEEDAS